MKPGDIPLANAQIIWDPDTTGLPQVKISTGFRDDDNRYNASWGACHADFNAASDAEKLNMLFKQFNYMTALDGVPAEALHETLMSIPEYRRALQDFGSIDPDSDQDD